MSGRGALAGVVLTAAVLTAAGAGAEPVVHLAWRPVTAVHADVQAAARREADALFARVGVGVVWEQGPDEIAAGTLPVVLLASGPSGKLPHRVLGASSPRRGVGAWVFYGALRAELGVRRAEDALSASDVRRLGRALGRVIVHEVVHAFQASPAHAARGLMGARVSALLLTADDVFWDAASQAALRHAVETDEPPPAAGGTIAAAW